MTNQTIEIRPITMEDYHTVLKWSKDQEFCLANGWDLGRSAEEMYRWWQHCVHNNKSDFIRMGIEQDGQLIGYLDLACIQNNSAELGIAIGNSAQWGKGIGTIAVKSMIEYASRKWEVIVFTAETHEANIRAQKMLNKIGFQEISREGTELYLGEVNQLIQYRLVFET